MAIELSVIVPCFNEEGNLPELVERTERVFDRRGIAGEIVLVNDGSRDGTGAQIDTLAATRPHVIGVHHPTNRGITEGWRSGLAASRGRYVCTIDADLQYQPEAIAVLYREMCFSRADLVQGWRSSLELRRYDIRYYMSRGLDHLLKLAFGMHEHDVKSGFVIYRREAFEDILAHAAGYFYFQHMITVVAKAKGYSIRQVETLFLERRAGQSFISLFPGKMIARTFVDIARGVMEFRLRETKDQSLALALGTGGERTRTEGATAPLPGPRVSHNAREYVGELERTQWLSADEIRQLQLKRLRRLLQHAYAHVGYYRELFSTAGIVPEDVRSLDDLAALPVLGRQTLRENLYFDLFATTHDARRLVKITTSGATGEPTALFADPFQLDMRRAHALRALGWTGHRHPARRARWARSEADGLRGALRAAVARERLFPGAVLDGPLAARYADWVRRERPALVSGDAETFEVVAGLLAAAGRDAHGAGAVHTWGQTLTPDARALIERVFGCPVFDEYGTRELGPLAHECSAHRGHHVNAESYVLEIVGGTGEVVVTDLNSRSVPLIRYHVGDLAVATVEPCACGRGLPVIERLVGRPATVVLGAQGRRIPGTVFAELFGEHEHAVLRYQVVQERADAVTLRLIRRSRFTPDTERAIRERVGRLLGPGVALELAFVDALPVGGPVTTCATPSVGPESRRVPDPPGRREVSR